MNAINESGIVTYPLYEDAIVHAKKRTKSLGEGNHLSVIVKAKKLLPEEPWPILREKLGEAGKGLPIIMC